jgi:hypothetical protein
MITISPIIMNLLKYFIRYILILIGLFMLLGYLWVRFMRERLPREIPFNLSLLGFVILLYLCLIYAYIVYILLSKSHSSNPIIKKLIDIIYKPLVTLDETIKNHPIINPYYERFIDSFPSRFGYLFKQPYYFYYTFAIFPRVVLVTALFIDIFYFNKLFYIYKVLLIGIFLLLNRYIIYSLKVAKELIILKGETLFKGIIVPYVKGVHPCEDPDDPSYDDPNAEDYEDDDDMPYNWRTMRLPLRIYVNFQSNAFVQRNYVSDPTVITTDKYDDIFCKKYNISEKDMFKGGLYLKETEADLERIMQIPLLVAYYTYADNFDPQIKILKVLIFTNYLLCWLYILRVSFHTLPSDTFQSIWKIIDIEDPFSIMFIEYSEMIMNVYVRSFIIILLIIIRKISLFYTIYMITIKVIEKYAEFIDEQEEFIKEKKELIRKIIRKPLETLDYYIKNHPLINPYYKRFIVYLANKVNPIHPTK